MNLERFRRNKLIVLNQDSMAYQAARAMEDNHIGAVLVSGPEGLAGIVTDRDLALAVLGGDLDPNFTTLADIMTEGVVTADVSASTQEVAQLMRDYRVRRVPISEQGRVAGLITFDDLVVDASIDIELLRDVVVAQLEVGAAQKPAGQLHPQGPLSAEQRAAGRSRSLVRARARAGQVYDKFINRMGEATGLDRERAERAMVVSLCMLSHRLVPTEARHLIAQLPSLAQPQFDACLDGPDRSVTTEAIRDELARALGMNQANADAVMRHVYQVVSEHVSSGQIEEVRGQLPEPMKDLFPVAGYERKRAS